VHAIGDVIIEAGASIWPGAIVGGDLVEAGWLVMGVPAKPVRTMGLEDVEERARLRRSVAARCRKERGEVIMEQRNLGKSGLSTSAIGLGLMSMSGVYGTPDDNESIAASPRTTPTAAATSPWRSSPACARASRSGCGGRTLTGTERRSACGESLR